MKYIGLKDNNIIYKMIDLKLMFDLIIKRKAVRYYINCLRKTYGKKAEVILLERLQHNNYGNLAYDTFKFLNLYMYIKSKNNEQFISYTEEEIAKMSFKELHDKTFHCVRNCASIYHNKELLKPLIMSEERIKMDNIEIEGVKFSVPKTFNEFSNLSDIFHNCVVTYYSRALYNYCHIVYAMKDNKPFACIELSKELYVVQCLGVGNKRLTANDYEVCEKYFNLIGAKPYVRNITPIQYYENNNIIAEDELPF